jgi:hypothetical protein
MNILLTCLENFQDYILINIDQLIKLHPLEQKIYIITNKHLMTHFEKYTNKEEPENNYITFYFVEDLPDSLEFNQKSILNSSFRNGFWKLTSYRFFVIYECMKKHSIENVIHLENDVLIYYPCSILESALSSDFLYIPFDCFHRNIASIVFIPNHTIFKQILDHYNVNENDMMNFRQIQLKTGLIDHFPIFKSLPNENDEEIKFVTKNYEKFQMIFDAAAIGQYIGGIDPMNDSRDTIGFVNETCIIKYNEYSIIWKNQTISNENQEKIKKPFLLYQEEEIPIFNLHIHSKRLSDFV